MDATNPRNTKPSDPKDPARVYAVQDPRNKNNFKCNFCFKVTKGGTFRLKKHLVRGFKEVTDCPSCLEHVKTIVREFMINKQVAKRTNQLLPRLNEVDEDSEDDEEVCFVTSMKRGSGSGEGTSKGPKSQDIRVQWTCSLKVLLKVKT
ncbi:general transcription factor IIF subunit 1-like protein [Tanacetum coccineum]